MRRFVREQSLSLLRGERLAAQRGSPESKPVGAAHHKTAVEG